MAPAQPREQWAAAFDGRPLNRALGIRARHIEAGTVELVVEPSEANAGISEFDAAFGFALTVAADLALVGAASTSVDLAREEMNGTAELNLTYVDAPLGPVGVRGTVIHRAAQLALVEIELRDAAGGLVAKGRGSYAIRQKRLGAAT